jgi:hypothetical protein
MRTFLPAVLLAIAINAVAQVPKDTVLTERRALVLGEPRVAVGQNVLAYSPSPTGRYLLALRREPAKDSIVLAPSHWFEPSDLKLVLWDSQTQLAHELANFPSGVYTDTTERRFLTLGITGIHWLTGTDKAIVVMQSKRDDLFPNDESRRDELYNLTELHFVDAAARTVKRLYTDVSERAMACKVFTSPVSPIAVMYLSFGLDPQLRSTFSLQVLDASGTWARTAEFGQDLKLVTNGSWSEDGRFLQLEVRFAPPGQRLSPRVLRFDPTTGKHDLLIGAVPSFGPPEVSRDVVLTSTASSVDGTHPSWWLESTEPTERARRLVTLESRTATLAHGERFVAFVSNGVLFTRMLAVFTLSQYEEWRIEDTKNEALMKAGQIDVAFSVFAQENDDSIPSASELRSALVPYLSSPSILDGFQLATTARSFKDIVDKAATVLGFVQTPVGRVVIYADRRQVWEKK